MSSIFFKKQFFEGDLEFPKYLFPCLMCCSGVIQILWLTFISNHKDEWTVLIVLFLQLWIAICVFRSRTTIRLLTEDLYRISNMLHVYTIQKKKMLKIFVWVYCVFVTTVTVFLAVTIFNSGMVAQEQQKLRNSEIVAARLKEHTVAILNGSFIFPLLVGNFFSGILPGYYCFACCCMKEIFLHFVWKSKVLIARQDYPRIIEIYKEMNETMIMMDDFLSLPILVSVVNIMASLFWYGYSFAFPPNGNNVTGIFVSIGFLQYFVLLLITLTPAAAVNQAAAMARELVLSLPGWIPNRYSIIKALICRSFMGKTSLTLWKIYRIDNSLLISAIGTLISYGILIGTLGSVQSSNNEN
ncbi:uncharacterized protein CEXT_369321 [Caerostris extrusa]|uniref:Gustatory receptor n=1 Tax=Caerostris extrusa TaxID=172846 RepID=A0AAV4XKQ9_CAEEX|nr:uncharacterized protein CEXT_369321 [Caerostris extrusa]